MQHKWWDQINHLKCKWYFFFKILIQTELLSTTQKSLCRTFFWGSWKFIFILINSKINGLSHLLSEIFKRLAGFVWYGHSWSFVDMTLKLFDMTHSWSCCRWNCCRSSCCRRGCRRGCWCGFKKCACCWI